MRIRGFGYIRKSTHTTFLFCMPRHTYTHTHTLVGRSPTFAENGRSGCKPIPRFVLAGYVIPLNLGRCNVSITMC